MIRHVLAMITFLTSKSTELTTQTQTQYHISRKLITSAKDRGNVFG